MRLLSDATTPFGRKVMVAALERGVSLDEEFIDLADPGLGEFNPLRQIPVLVTNEGQAIYDSMTILLYLDGQHQGPPLFPDADRWGVMTRAALCDGLMEAVLQRVMERRRPQREQSPGFIAKLENRVTQVLGSLERIVGSKAARRGPMLADEIAAACALGYVDFRFSTEWRKDHPRAAAWLAAHADRPSLARTAPTRTAPFAAGSP